MLNLPLGSDLTEIHTWQKEVLPKARIEIFGKFSQKIFDFRIDRFFDGFMFRFAGPTAMMDAMLFKMCWFSPVIPYLENKNPQR